MTKERIIAIINNFIHENNNQEITGNVLNSVLRGLVDFADSNINTGLLVPSTSVLNYKNETVDPSTIDLGLLIPEENESAVLTVVPTGYKVAYKLGNQEENVITAGGETNGILLQGLELSDTFTAKLLEIDESDEKLLYSINMVVNDFGSGGSGSGRNGDYTQYIYKKKSGTSAPSITQTYSASIPSGWSKTFPEPQDGYNIWMSCRQITYSASNVPSYEDPFSDPIRMTGEDGKPGTDGKSIEFIYTRNNTGEKPDAPFYDSENNPVNEQDDWHGVDSNGITWTDNPQGVTQSLMYEYVCQRVKTNDAWGPYQPLKAAVWAKWGENGRDGDGYEYIFKHFQTLQTFGNNDNNPAYWPETQTEDYLGPTGYQWSDNPQGVDSTNRYEYVSMRRKTSGVWGAFSIPALWAQYVPQGVDGGRYVNMFQQIESATVAPEIPTTEASIESMELDYNWSLECPEQLDGQYIWMTEAFFGSDDTASMWSNPVRITGDNGKPGEDGNSTEYIYKSFTEPIDWSQVTSSGNPENWSAVQTQDYTGPEGYKWNDNPTGVDETTKYEYISKRDYKIHSGTSKSWGTFTRPVLWSNYGERGMDGDGMEYVFARTIEKIAPFVIGNPNHDGTSYSDDDYCPQITGATTTLATDNPQGVDEVNRYEWFITRKKTLLSDGKTRVWGPYPTGETLGKMELWANWGETGDKGAAGEFFLVNPISEKLSVQLTSFDNYESIVGQLLADFKYVVAHSSGDTVTYLDDLTGYELQVQIDKHTNGEGKYSSSGSTPYDILVLTDTTGTDIGLGAGIKYYNLYRNNILTETQSASTEYDSSNYYELFKNAPQNLPTKVDVSLIKDGSVVDKRTVNVEFEPSHVFNAGDSALNSVYQGLTNSNGSYTSETGFSQIFQNWQNINLSVSNIEHYRDGDIPENSNSENYCFKLITNPTPPSTPGIGFSNWNTPPSGWVFYNSDNPYPTELSQNQYMFMSAKIRTGGYNETTGVLEWDNENPTWNRPVLFEKYGSSRGSVNSAQLDITAESIATRVYSDNISGYTTHSEVEQTANNITMQVVSGLTATGIDIEHGTINLKANKVTFSNSDGTVTDKISIDPTTGTLHADDVELSGMVYKKKVVINPNNSSQYMVDTGQEYSGQTVYVLNVVEAGSWVELQGFIPGIRMILPSIDCTKTYTEEEKNKARSLIGTKMIITSTSNPVTYICGFYNTHMDYYGSVEGYGGRVLYQDDNSNMFFSNKEIVYLECVLADKVISGRYMEDIKWVAKEVRK